MSKLIAGVFWFTTNQIESIDAREWTKDVLVMVKGHCGPLDTHPVWVTRETAASLLFPQEEAA
jgi:hypothetical protein